MKKPELLSPAGDFESLKAAIYFGADAVYIGGTEFSMRTSPANFSLDGIKEAVDFAHSKGVRVFLTCNTLPRNEEIERLPRFLSAAASAGVDAFIISDYGVMELARRYAPSVDIHISTQTGVVNFAAANALYNSGAKRAVLARELSLTEISKIRETTPAGLEIETFVHGSMCVSFSGRCLLSSYLAARDANRGDCAQPCRWNYHLMEEKRKGVFLPVFEDERGTHILNAKDLCMLEHIPELINAGISSFKIEGRAKSAYYTAVVTNAYRLAIDAYMKQRNEYHFDSRLMEEVQKVSHREYCTGFYFGPIQNGQVYQNESYQRSYDIVALVEECNGSSALCRQRNRFETGDSVEVLSPGTFGESAKIVSLRDDYGRVLKAADHPDMWVRVQFDLPVKAHSIVRKISECKC